MEKDIEKFPASTLFDEMNKCHVTGKHRVAVIVFSSDNWPNKNYSLESRSYETPSGTNGWDYSKIGTCRIGSALDGSDYNIRLDYQNWKIDYWYWK